MLLPILACLLFPTEGTVSQHYDFNGLDVLSGNTQEFVVQPFDTSLGTLTNVQIVVEGYRWFHKVRLTNRTPNYYPAQEFASGIGVVPWIHGDDRYWSMLSFTTTVMPNPGESGETPVIPPFSDQYLLRSLNSDLFECGGLPMDWGPYYFDLPAEDSYWTTDPVTLRFVPTWWCNSYLIVNGILFPWPGECTAERILFGMRYRIDYTYQP